MATKAFTQSVGNRAFTIFGEAANLDYFFNNLGTADSTVIAEDRSATFAGSSARRFPGDPNPISRSGGTRHYLYDNTRRSGRGLPGRTVTIRQVKLEPGDTVEVRSFSVKGRWIDFHAWMTANAKMKIEAINASGAISTINAAT
jgi:hypothetical protein